LKTDWRTLRGRIGIQNPIEIYNFTFQNKNYSQNYVREGVLHREMQGLVAAEKAYSAPWTPHAVR